MPLASTFRHPTSKSGIRAFWYWTGSPYSGTGLVLASAFFYIPVPVNPGLRKLYEGGKMYILHVHTTALVERHPECSYSSWWSDTLYVHTTGGRKTPGLHDHTGGGGQECTLHPFRLLKLMSDNRK
jgi:hypothetical protein